MHKIQDRPVVVNGQIVIRPMMYLALSYDHRIVDGKGAVTFLVRVKEALELVQIGHLVIHSLIQMCIHTRQRASQGLEHRQKRP